MWIFEKGIDRTTAKEIVQRRVEISEEAKAVLSASLRTFFFMGDEDDLHMELLLNAMERKEVSAGTMLIKEDEEGDEMYVVETGELSVAIGDRFVRELGPGKIVGELALLYNAPRSATVQCKTDCVVWVLRRDLFKLVQARSSSASISQRLTWMMNAPYLSKVDRMDLTRLAGTLGSLTFQAGEIICKAGEPLSYVYLVEKGQLFAHDSPTQFQTELRKSSDKTQNGVQFLLAQGSMFGLDALAARIKFGQSAEPLATHTIECITPVRLSYFSMEMMERITGPLSSLFDPSGAVTRRSTLGLHMMGTSSRSLLEMSEEDFVTRGFLGHGSFGVVTLEEHVTGTVHGKLFAVKRMSKSAVLEGGQLRHVLDEKRLLSEVDCPFIVKIFGSYQTRDSLVLVTEFLSGGDLWSVIYEADHGPTAGHAGIAVEWARFYMVGIISALAHLHNRTIAYRDLKPENVLLDSQGYPRLIDFGFAKKIPYVVESNGQSQICVKSYTLCGTPEYLAPEFIFNSGHDHTVDLWAVGVLFYEMIMGRTPFAPADADDMTALFGNIAHVHRGGLVLPQELSTKCGEGCAIPDLLLKLLNANPTQRLGDKAKGTSDILCVPPFSEIDVESITQRTATPPFMPAPYDEKAPHKSMSFKLKSFDGDQSLFDAF